MQELSLIGVWGAMVSTSSPSAPAPPLLLGLSGVRQFMSWMTCSLVMMSSKDGLSIGNNWGEEEEEEEEEGEKKFRHKTR